MSVKDFTVTYATLADIPEIFAMSKSLIDSYEDVGSIDYDKVLAWVQRKISENIATYRCVFLKGVKAGYYRLAAESGETELDDLYILPEFQGQGLGTAVLQRCIDSVETPMFLYVFKRNIGAIKLYARMGFSISKEVGNTRYIMRREVDRPGTQVYNNGI